MKRMIERAAKGGKSNVEKKNRSKWVPRISHRKSKSLNGQNPTTFCLFSVACSSFFSDRSSFSSCVEGKWLQTTSEALPLGPKKRRAKKPRDHVLPLLWRRVDREE